MISVQLAKRLRSSGLSWQPGWGDLFHIPDRNLDDRAFVVADLSVDMTILADGIGAITFNGSAEWSLDYILTQEVIWLPSEPQLRDRIGDRFCGLIANADGYRCEIETDFGVEGFEASTAADAYGLAVLNLL
jgi:hypothetical protein